MKKFEYKTIDININNATGEPIYLNKLNEFGQEGWQLVFEINMGHGLFALTLMREIE